MKRFYSNEHLYGLINPHYTLTTATLQALFLAERLKILEKLESSFFSLKLLNASINQESPVVDYCVAHK